MISTTGSGNPLLSERTWDGQSIQGLSSSMLSVRSDVMTMTGAAIKTLMLLGVVIIVAAVVWTYAGAWAGLVVLGGSLASLVLSLAAGYLPKYSAFFAVPIAVCQGALAGGVSLLYAGSAASGKGALASLDSGIILQSFLLTASIAVGMLILYAARIINVTERYRMVVGSAIMGICLVSLLTLVLSLFGVRVPYLWGSGVVGIAWSGFIVITAALTLALDFERIEAGALSGQPKHMEWYAGIALMVSLVWLYISILRLLAKLRNR
jgi:uncharacterized YccA/Bax inhibitor family protein